MKNWPKPQPVEPPAAVEEPAPRPPAREAKIFTTGFTFAERKAARLAREAAESTPKRRLASYGTQQRWLEPAGRTGMGRMITMELLADVQTGAGYQRSVPYGTLEPLASTSGGEETVEYLGRINPTGGSGLFAPANPETITPIS